MSDDESDGDDGGGDNDNTINIYFLDLEEGDETAAEDDGGYRGEKNVGCITFNSPPTPIPIFIKQAIRI